MSKDYKRLIIISILVGVGLTLCTLPCLFFNVPGIFIGTAIGAAIEVPCVFFLLKGVDITTEKGNLGGVGIFYFLRMLLFAGGMVLCALLQYVAKIPEFNYSVWGVLIGYTPMQIVVVLVIYLSHPMKKYGEK